MTSSINRSRGHLVAIVLSLLVAPPARGQEADLLRLENYRRAREVVLRARQVMGTSMLRERGAYRFVAKGRTYARLQSLAPDEPLESFDLAIRAWYDPDHQRAMMDQDYGFPGGVQFFLRLVARPDTAIALNRDNGVYLTVPGGGAFDFIYRSASHALLEKAWKNPSSLSWLGVRTIGDRTHQAVSFEWDRGSTYLLLFDDDSGRLARMQTLVPDPWAGDGILEIVFSDYLILDGVHFASEVTLLREGVLVASYGRSVQFGTAPDSLFTIPRGSAPVASSQPTVVEIAPGVHTIENIGATALGSYRILFVDLGEGIAVVDAPLNSRVTEFLITKIKETVPGKPISYVILTHYHVDHVGGVRPFVAEGARLVTTEGNREYFERLVSRSSTLLPDPRDASKEKLDFLLVDGEVVLTGPDRSVRVINIGPTPHVEELLLTYLPQEEILFDGDLITSYRPTIPITRFYRNWLDRFEDPVTLLVGTHHPNLTPAEFAEVMSTSDQ